MNCNPQHKIFVSRRKSYSGMRNVCSCEKVIFFMLKGEIHIPSCEMFVSGTEPYHKVIKCLILRQNHNPHCGIFVSGERVTLPVHTVK